MIAKANGIGNKEEQLLYPSIWKKLTSTQNSPKEINKFTINLLNNKWYNNKQREFYYSNIHIPNTDMFNFTKQNLPDVKEPINSNTAILGNFNISFLLKWMSSRQNLDRETLELNEITNQMDLIDP